MISVVGREHELAELARLLAVPVAGSGAIVLDGVAGIGKTTVWEQAALGAGERTWRVLAARTSQSELRLPYVGLGDLLSDVDAAVLEGLATPVRRALEVALLQAEPDGGPLAQRAVAAGFLSVLERLAAVSPVVVAVDDSQWLDRGSASALEFAARRLGPQPVWLLFSQRTGDPEPFPFERACRNLTRIEVGPLSARHLHELIGARTGAPLPRRRLAEIDRISAGNPLFALELARVSEGSSSRDGDVPRLPSTLSEAIRGRIEALPRPTRDALLTAALASRPSVGLIEEGTLTAAEEAEVVRITPDGMVAFTHPLLMWEILGSASARQHSAAHARLADHAPSAEERLLHRALAAEGPSEELAAELEETAGAVRARGAPAAAADLLAQARRLTPAADAEAWARRCAQEIGLLLEAGDWGQAWALGEEARQLLPAGPPRAAVLLAAAHRPGVSDLCLQALEEAAGDPVLSIRARLALAQQCFYDLDPAATAHARTAVRLARELGDPATLVLSLTASGVVEFLVGVGDPVPELEEALVIERELGFSPLPIAASARCYRALCHICSDEFDAAQTLLDELLGEAIEGGDESSQAQLLEFRGVLELRVGEWASAGNDLEASIRLSDLMEFAQGGAEKRAWLGVLRAREGKHEAARVVIDEGMRVSEAIGDGFGIVVGHAALAHIALVDDEPLRALEHLGRIRRLIPAGSEPAWAEFQGDELEALIASGSTGQARQLIDLLERRAGAQPRPNLEVWSARGRALLLQDEGDVTGALEALATLLRGHDLPLAPFEQARTLLLTGVLERRSKRKKAARDAFERAAEIFDRLGAVAWAEKTQKELDRVRPPGQRGDLSETERRAAKLAAAGKSNREIAAELHISRRTVETNLARVYRKVRVKNRVELTKLIADGTLDL